MKRFIKLCAISILFWNMSCYGQSLFEFAFDHHIDKLKTEEGVPEWVKKGMIGTDINIDATDSIRTICELIYEHGKEKSGKVQRRIENKIIPSVRSGSIQLTKANNNYYMLNSLLPKLFDAISNGRPALDIFENFDVNSFGDRSLLRVMDNAGELADALSDIKIYFRDLKLEAFMETLCDAKSADVTRTQKILADASVTLPIKAQYMSSKMLKEGLESYRFLPNSVENILNSNQDSDSDKALFIRSLADGVFERIDAYDRNEFASREDKNKLRKSKKVWKSAIYDMSCVENKDGERFSYVLGKKKLLDVDFIEVLWMRDSLKFENYILDLKKGKKECLFSSHSLLSKIKEYYFGNDGILPMESLLRCNSFREIISSENSGDVANGRIFNILKKCLNYDLSATEYDFEEDLWELIDALYCDENFMKKKNNKHKTLKELGGDLRLNQLFVSFYISGFDVLIHRGSWLKALENLKKSTSSDDLSKLALCKLHWSFSSGGECCDFIAEFLEKIINSIRAETKSKAISFIRLPKQEGLNIENLAEKLKAAIAIKAYSENAKLLVCFVDSLGDSPEITYLKEFDFGSGKRFTLLERASDKSSQDSKEPLVLLYEKKS